MNIFHLDEDPVVCAQYHINRHVHKLNLEAIQLLSTTLHEFGYPAPYEPTHLNHPCRLWTRSRENAKWLFKLGIALSNEYTHRYNKPSTLLPKLEQIEPYLDKLDNITYAPALCMPEQFKVMSPILSYRMYYQTKLFTSNGYRMDKWTNRESPWWFYLKDGVFYKYQDEIYKITYIGLDGIIMRSINNGFGTIMGKSYINALTKPTEEELNKLKAQLL